MKVRKIRVEIYRTNLFVLVTKNKDDVKKWFSKKKITISDFTEDARGAHWEYDIEHYIWIETLKDISEICHEVTHACYGILNDHGVNVSPDNHEALTYLQTFLLDKILEK